MRQAAALAIVLACAGAPLPAQEHQHGAGDRLGTVRFENSCSAAAQPSFARGMALLHSFEFGPAFDAFEAVSSSEPSCGIALWGMALAQWGNPFSAGNRQARQLDAGRETAARAAAAGAKTGRERAYITAAAALYDRFESVDQRTRMQAYRDAMGRVAAAYPADPEAKAFYGLALAAAADPADKTFASQLKAGAMLETLWAAQPDHPGLAHYIIHSYDVPALAPKALDAARRYAKIAPDAPHALHMPSHTFTRLGSWQESIDTNLLSAAAAKKNGQIYEELHASDYEVYAYLQTGQDAKARAIVDEAPRMAARVNATAGAAPPAAGGYALAAIPARYALERGAWADAAKLEVRPGQVPYAEALTWFARALGAARSGATEEAHKNIAMIRAAEDKLAAANEPYWSGQVQIQRELAQAWTAFAEGQQQRAVSSMLEAAAKEDRTEKAAVTPGPLAPAHELLGEMLLEMKRPEEALAHFRLTIAKEPNRFRGLAGAAAAAEQAGDAVAARAYRQQLAAICAKGDTPGRPELEAARRAATSRIP